MTPAISNIMFWTKPRSAEPLTIGGATVAVVRSSRARTMRLSLDRKTGGVRLTLPKRAALAPALAWARSKQSWIAAQLRARPVTAIVPGMTLNVAGRPLVLIWDETAPRTPRIVSDTLVVGGPLDALEARLGRWLKAEALRVLTAESHDYAARCGVSVTRVGVGDPVSRWGSCSGTGAIRYSWRLILMPPQVRRATVAHEVAHRVHMDHSPRFHSLVAQIADSDPKAARAWLARHGVMIQGIGSAS